MDSCTSSYKILNPANLSQAQFQSTGCRAHFFTLVPDKKQHSKGRITALMSSSFSGPGRWRPAMLGIGDRLFQDFSKPLEYGGWLVHDSFRQRLELFTGDRLDVHSSFLGLGQKFRIVHRFDVSFAEDIHPSTGVPGPAIMGRPKSPPRKMTSATRRLSSGYFPYRRFRKSLARHRCGRPVSPKSGRYGCRILFVPGIERLTAEVGGDGHAAAHHLALLDGDVDFTAAGIT